MPDYHFDTHGFWFAIRFLAVPFLALLIVIELTGFSLNVPPERALISESFTQSVIPPVSSHEFVPRVEPTIIRLGFVGDIMMDRSVEEKVRKHGKGDFNFIFEHIAPELQSFDFMFGNLEGPISDKGRNVGSKYSFRMDPLSASALRNAGFDAVSLANNHMSDWGVSALIDTMERLNTENIMYAGAGHTEREAYEAAIISVRDFDIALLAYSEFNSFFEADETPGMAILKKEKVIEGIEKANAMADFVIVSFHWGAEYQKSPSAFQKELAHASIDAGADLVIGHHPHVTQSVERYKDAYIAYSLGNFVFDQYFSKDTMEGGLFEVEVTNGVITDTVLRKVILNEYFQPKLADIVE